MTRNSRNSRAKAQPKTVMEVTLSREALGASYTKALARWTDLAQKYNGQVLDEDGEVLIRFVYGPEFDPSVLCSG